MRFQVYIATFTAAAFLAVQSEAVVINADTDSNTESYTESMADAEAYLDS